MKKEPKKTEIADCINSLRSLYGWRDNELDLVKSMMEGIYLSGTIDGYQQCSQATTKIVGEVFNGK